jgi:hypothetical protein
VLHRIGLIIYRIFLHPLSKYPGPKYLAISGLTRFYYENVRGEFYKEIRDLHDQYGNIVRIAPNELSIDGSIGWEDIYGHKKAGKLEFLKDLLFYQGVGVPGAQHILGADKETHRRQRRLMGHAFSDSALNGQEGIIKSYIDLLILRLGENAAKGNVVDFVKWYVKFRAKDSLAFPHVLHFLNQFVEYLSHFKILTWGSDIGTTIPPLTS